MKYISTLLFLSVVFSINGQIYEQFEPTVLQPCVFDENTAVYLPENWEVYQTDDGHWTGIRDTSCYSFFPDTKRLPLGQFEPDSKIFIRKDFSPTSPISRDRLYDVDCSLNESADVQLLVDTCGAYLCSGVRLLFEIPDESGQGSAIREHMFSFSSPEDLWLNACLASEYFDEQELVSVIIELSVANSPLGSYIDFLSFNLSELNEYFFKKVYAMDIPEYSYDGINSYNLDLSVAAGEYGQNYLFMFDTMKYPSSNYTHFIDANLEENKPDPQDINVYLGYEHVSFQPQVELRGGLVENGVDRHNLTFINEGAEFCISFIEFSFGGSGGYVHREGQFNFTHKLGCLKFQDDAIFEIDAGANLVYGASGSGILFCKENSKIQLHEGAILNLNNQLLLGREPEPLIIELGPQSHLSFGDQAYIRDKPVGERRKIMIVNNGGSIDLSRLSPNDQKRFLFADETTIDQQNESFFSILQFNSFELIIEIQSDINQDTDLTVYNSSGQQAITLNYPLYKGYNQQVIPIYGLSRGMYIMEAKLSDGDIAHQKFMVP